MAFELDSRLEADTAYVADLALTTVRLMRDKRFPWLILVPRHEGLVELTDLSLADRRRVMDEVADCSTLLQDLFPDTHKMNVAALGNMVRQLHVHVIARRTSDAAWPNPVWGVGTAVPYDVAAEDALLKKLRQALGYAADIGETKG